MSQMIVFLLFIIISTFALSAEQNNRIKCLILGTEDKIYYFDTQTRMYRLSVNEKGRAKTSLSKQVRQQTDRTVESTKKISYSFQIDDRTEINVDMNTDTRRGTGEIKLRAKGHTKKFDGCEYVAATSESSI